MERIWKIDVSIKTGIGQEVRDSIISNLEAKFSKVEIKRKVGIPYLLLDNFEVKIFPRRIEIYLDEITNMKVENISYLVEIFYKNAKVKGVRIGIKKPVYGEVEEIQNKLESMFHNKVTPDSVFLSYEFAKVYEAELVLFTVVLNTEGYHIQIECLGESIEQIGIKIDFINKLLERKEITHMLSLGDVDGS